MKIFQTQELLTTARERTGLSNFGDPAFLENLEMVIGSVNAGGAISDRRWNNAYEYFVRLLVNRLWFEKDLTENPEILNQELLPPVAIISLPRTGSTKTQRLLGESDAFQNLLWWHMHMFAQIPGAPNGGRAERLRITKEFEAWCDEASPNLKYGHARYAEKPEEEQILQEFMFAPTLAVQFSGSDYTPEQLMNTKAQPIYDYMAKQLKYLQWQFHKGQTKPWLLKAPGNMSLEKELVNTFGRKMKVITTHRDPLNIANSIAKLGESFRTLFSDHQDKESLQKLAKNMLLGFSYAINQHMAWRDENPDIEILDIGFKDIHNNTSDVLERVYEFLDIKLTDDIRKRVASWDDEQSKTHKGHSYDFDEFGLTKDEIYQAFAPYMNRFSSFL